MSVRKMSDMCMWLRVFMWRTFSRMTANHNVYIFRMSEYLYVTWGVFLHGDMLNMQCLHLTHTSCATCLFYGTLQLVGSKEIYYCMEPIYIFIYIYICIFIYIYINIYIYIYIHIHIYIYIYIFINVFIYRVRKKERRKER